MKKIAKIVLVLIVLIAVVEIVVLSFGPFSKRVEKNSVLTLRIEGAIDERTPHDSFVGTLLGSSTSVSDMIEALDRASTDPRIAGMQMEVGESTLGIAQIQQLRRKLGEFHRAGKFSIAYLEFGTNRSYYLASAGQTVVLLPTSLLNIHGMMTSTTFLRGTFDKLGIYPDFYHIGDYKNATNIYQEKKYTPAHREADQALLEDLYNQYVQGVAESRRISPVEAGQLIARGPFSSPEALAAKLIDRVAYADEFRDLVDKKNGGHNSRVSVKEYLNRTERGGLSKVAVILASGMILPGKSANNPFGEEMMGADTIAEQFKSAREDDSIKAVILRIDSPGGAAFASEVIRRELLLTKKQMPVVVSMSNVAASGGYWIAMSANRIVAEPGTITGSIGVLSGKFNLLGLYEKLGLTKDHLVTAENSTFDWSFQNFTPAQRDSMQRYMHEIYDNFIRGVAEGRKMDVAAVDKIAQGRVWSGERARDLGLVDELGGLDTAISSAKKLANIPAGEKVDLVYLPPPKDIFQQIHDLLNNTETFSRPASVQHWLARIEAFARVPAWTLLPAVPEIQ
ncbi:MAG: signal peptide peptidase SppA [Acidobacteria bacterium]|nr:signal peptide peptidase SppA [Acidobacteriota bacterium]